MTAVRHCAFSALVILLGASATAEPVKPLGLSYYSYDTVCDFTGRYFRKLERRIDPKEWEAITQGKGKRSGVLSLRKQPDMMLIIYSHKGLHVQYSPDAKKGPQIWEVDLDQSRVSQSLQTREQFIKLFNVTPSAAGEPSVSLECDGQTLTAVFDKKQQVRKLSLVMAPGVI